MAHSGPDARASRAVKITGSILRATCCLPLRWAAALLSIVLLAAIVLSVRWQCCYNLQDRYNFVLESGVLTFGKPPSPTASRPSLWGRNPLRTMRLGFEKSKNRLQLIECDWLPKYHSSNRSIHLFSESQEHNFQSATEVFLWAPLLLLVVYAAFAFGYVRRASAPSPWRTRTRLAISAVAVCSLALSGLWAKGSHIFLDHDRGYIAFPGGAVTIGKEPPVGSYRLRAYAVVLPRYEGPRANEFVGTWSLHLPFWHIALVSSAAAAWMQGRLVAFQLRNRAWCIRCGYSLDGLTATRCPECGTEFMQEAQSPSPMPPEVGVTPSKHSVGA